MKSTPAIRPHDGRLFALASIAIGLLSSCGGGGGGASDLKVKSTIFGFDPFTGGFDASGQQGEAPLIPVNMSVVFDFTANLVPSCVQRRVDHGPGDRHHGHSALPRPRSRRRRSGDRAPHVSPLIAFSTRTSGARFNPDTTYQILFQVPPSTSVVRSTEGRTILASDRGPYRFRTSAVVLTRSPGRAVPTMRL
jgi:hypothetical protein